MTVCGQSAGKVGRGGVGGGGGDREHLTRRTPSPRSASHCGANKVDRIDSARAIAPPVLWRHAAIGRAVASKLRKSRLAASINQHWPCGSVHRWLLWPVVPPRATWSGRFQFRSSALRGYRAKATWRPPSALLPPSPGIANDRPLPVGIIRKRHTQ
uniref:Uncharacterized protein n=1 Tax=Plectus sambesii TaxID=2011161 RepID=A0A914XLY8_9BILA